MPPKRNPPPTRGRNDLQNDIHDSLKDLTKEAAIDALLAYFSTFDLVPLCTRLGLERLDRERKKRG